MGIIPAVDTAGVTLAAYVEDGLHHVKCCLELALILEQGKECGQLLGGEEVILADAFHSAAGNHKELRVVRNLQASCLSELLWERKYLVAPCGYDCLSAKAIEATGFDIMGTTGYGMHGVILGQPDTGLLAINESVTMLKNMCDAVDIPILADAEGGFGNALNVVRTVREYENAGVAGLFIEDQKQPPNCPFIKFLTYPVSSLFAQTYAIMHYFEYLKKNETDEGYDGNFIEFEDYLKFIGVERIKEMGKKYGLNE